ncbi:hypothetical protein AAF712_014491 [Marasmius tenuissimus]|uniref:Uncharacterized protein n=1 Tax=Marasmius tenuissimus TaxID=585030 RepID=A0ABR2ZBY0_9AGAR
MTTEQPNGWIITTTQTIQPPPPEIPLSLMSGDASSYASKDGERGWHTVKRESDDSQTSVNAPPPMTPARRGLSCLAYGDSPASSFSPNQGTTPGMAGNTSISHAPTSNVSLIILHPASYARPQDNNARFQVVFVSSQVGIFSQWMGMAERFVVAVPHSRNKAYNGWDRALYHYALAWNNELPGFNLQLARQPLDANQTKVDLRSLDLNLNRAQPAFTNGQ